MRELSVAEQRYQAVMAVIGDGLAVSQVAVEAMGGSKQIKRVPSGGTQTTVTAPATMI